ncbi:receptor-like protein 12 [Salvia hispanica]|uniref:receptor-like protein 12 n=1 Tax=Salvia hispanica TaxID=49212 RepID=UPI002009ABA6|nr:receptor-like protein 12 [Salvia hispanica]
MAVSLLLQLLFIFLLSPKFTTPNATHAQTQYCLENEKTLLLELKNELVFNSSYSEILVHWNQKDDCCFWKGVECDNTGHVIHLRLDYGRLRWTKRVVESFQTQIPGRAELGRQFILRFSGAIPSTLSNLTQLVHLVMADNFFSGSISSGHFEGFAKIELDKILSLIPNLRVLTLSKNNLSRLSSNPFPVSQSSLDHLDLSDNKIAGEIPSWIWEIGNRSLTYLNFSCNMLVGFQKPYKIPSSLHFLDLHSNQLRGEFPSLSMLKYPTNVDFSNNYFEKFGILETGTDARVSLRNNSLSGSIPAFFCKAASFVVLDLSVNYLSGSIPPLSV